MPLIKGYPEGSDICLLNMWYKRPERDQITGKYDDGSMTVVYRDNKTGEKKHQVTKNPKCRFYVAKPDVYLPTNELFLEESKLDKVIVPYKDQLRTIAKLTGNEEFFAENIRNRNFRANEELYTHPRIFNADYHLEDHWRAIFAEQYTNTPTEVSKSYFDIEVDGTYAVGDFPEPGECPINALTIIDEKHNKVHTLLLEDPTNPLIEEFKQSISKELFDELKAFITEQVGGWKNAVRFGIDKFDYNFHFYKADEEIKLIQDAFVIINTYKPDFVLAWNMAFDIPYVIARIKKLGYNPADIMCHPDFKDKVVSYYVDERNYNEYAERGDHAVISSYSIFADQMIQFASRRKGQAAFPSYRLDDIGFLIAGVRKVNYHHITHDLTMLPKLNYKLFVFYNIIDTIVQKCIEARVGDIDYIYNKSLVNNTRLDKAHRQTIYLMNRGIKSFRTENDKVYIMGNNVNKFHPSTESFKGAFVANAQKVSDYAKMRINDIPVMLFPNLVDYDYKALYPSCMRQMNMAQNTMIGFIHIPKPVFENENRYQVERFVRGGSYLEDLQSGVFLEFGSRWFCLASYAELYEDVINYLGMCGLSATRYDPYKNSVNPFYVAEEPAPVNPFIINPNLIVPFIINNPIPMEAQVSQEEIKESQYANIRF